MSIRVAVIDPYRLVRDGLRLLFEAEGDLEVVGEGSTPREAVSVCDKAKPDVVICDLPLPGSIGTAALNDLHRRRPQCRVLVLNGENDARIAAIALNAGAVGFATKNQRGQEVVAAIRVVARGDLYLAPPMTRQTVEEHQRSLARGKRSGPLGELSEREQQVFELVVRGLSNQEVARELGISIKTVETHRTHINRKLDVHSPAELVRVAAERGLIKGRRRSYG
ncbi:MAG TPA: response regulator transcription factor [Kofleriaceae bacterium]|nr:response regulator transcription factor [Kofleriaceae bacterium]